MLDLPWTLPENPRAYVTLQKHVLLQERIHNQETYQIISTYGRKKDS